MSSWHAPSCAGPKVVLNKDKVPTCRSCRQTFAPYSDSTDFSFLPRSRLPEFDIPRSQSKLRWPQSVRYYSSSESQQGPPPQPPTETDEYSDVICRVGQNEVGEERMPETFGHGFGMASCSSRERLSRRLSCTCDRITHRLTAKTRPLRLHQLMRP